MTHCSLFYFLRAIYNKKKSNITFFVILFDHIMILWTSGPVPVVTFYIHGLYNKLYITRGPEGPEALT